MAAFTSSFGWETESQVSGVNGGLFGLSVRSWSCLMLGRQPRAGMA